MASSSLATLGALRIKAKYRSDMQNNPAITTPEWNGYISDSYKALYDLLIAAYGNNYYVRTPYDITLNTLQLYDLPEDFYKLLGVDLQYSASPTGWITLKRFEFIDRNKYSYLQPSITNAQMVRLWAAPKPTPLEYLLCCETTLNSAVISLEDASHLQVGMSVSGDGIQNNTLISSIDTNTNEVTLSKVATATQPVATLSFWIDSVQIDGISGWEEFIIIDSAIKAGIKQEFDINDLRIERQRIQDRIEAMAEGRDIGQAFHSVDALSLNSWGSYPIPGANIRYTLLGNQIMLVPGDSWDQTNSGWGWY